MAKPKEMLSDVDVDLVSYVGKAANKQKFQIFKSADSQDEGGQQLNSSSQQPDQMTGFFAGLKELVTKFAGGGQGKGPVIKADFASAWGSRKIKDDYWDLWYTLDDILWEILFKVPVNDEEALTTEQKAAMVATSIDQFKGILVDLISSPAINQVAVMKSAQKVHDAFLAKAVGSNKRLTAGRIEALTNAHSILGEILADVTAPANNEAETDKAEDDKKKGDDEVDIEQVQEVLGEAIQKAMEPINERLEKLEKSEVTKDTSAEADAGADEQEEIAKSVEAAIQKAMEPLNERLAAIEKARGMSQGAEGEEEPVSKSVEGGFGGAFL